MTLGLALGLRLGNGGSGTSASFTVSLTGLTGGYAIVGGHASIGYTINPDNGTDTVKWSNSADPLAAATYGTGAAPTDYTAGEGNPLYCHVTDGGETVTKSATIAKTQATGGVDLDLAFAESAAIASTDLIANWTANGNTLTLVSVSPTVPSGLSVSSAGVMTGTPASATADATYTITMQDTYGRQTSDTFTLEITAADTTNPIINTSSYTDATRTLALTYTETNPNRIFWVGVANPSTPNSSQILAGTGGGILEAGDYAATASQVISVTNESIDEIHIVMTDVAGNVSAIEVVTGVTVDSTAPTFSSGEVGNIDADTVEITTTETLSGTVDYTDFTLTGNTITAASISSGKIRLTLGTTATGSDDYTGDLSYSGTGSSVTDAYGNALATFSGQNVTNNVASGTTAPTISDTPAGAESGSATSLTLSSWAHGTGSNRKVIVMAGTFANPNAATLSCTYDGVAMEKIQQVNTGTAYERVAMFQILEANLPGGGSGDIVLSNGGVTATDLGLVAFTIQDCEQVAAASMDAVQAAGAATDTVTPDTADSLVIGFGHGSTSASGADWTAGLTRVAVSGAPGAGSWPYHPGASGTSTILVGQKANQPASLLTCTHDMSSGRPAIILQPFRPA